MGRPRRPIEERFWSQVEKTESCWLWRGNVMNTGYGRIRLGGAGGEQVTVHRLVYKWLVGPIPDGMLIDHKCRVRICVNPAHLQLATHLTNNQNQQGAHRDSRVGVRGVHYDTRHGRYVARASLGGKRYYAGEHADRASAEAAAIALRNRIMTNNLADRAAPPNFDPELASGNQAAVATIERGENNG